MRKAKILALGLIAVAALSGCSNSADEEVSVVVDMGDTSTDTTVTPEVTPDTGKLSMDGLDQLEEETEIPAAAQAEVSEDGTVSVLLSANARATEEEAAIEEPFVVHMADYNSFVLHDNDVPMEEMRDILVMGAMRISNISGDMELREGDTVTVSIASVDGYDELANEAEGLEMEIILGHADFSEEVDRMIIEQGVGGTVQFTEEGDDGEEYTVTIQILSATGKREEDDLDAAWLAANQPEYTDANEFVNSLVEQYEANVAAQDQDDAYVGEELLDRFVEESTVEGLSYEDDRRRWNVAAEAALAADLGVDISTEAFEAYLAEEIEASGAGSQEEYLEEKNYTLDDEKYDFVVTRLGQALAEDYRAREGSD